ncbi:4-hydroxy-tetrahydrodipicolinate reductase [Luteimonas aestuarii]|uniref:4-hydroxy-tetrahydrodipicolinate reductase n=1 Tax=Luteimonas aestuarii TaxID=453837 RepID=A0A4R5TLJ1_9GAMM|nr:dihydrodipicolinate reductase C-terminal domain-containing protein [Luteimonas aestuarii]TDK23416.1 4-hydroxy-tetrahydrodipicolinate reductase [Luteimonas aestuarii]
MPKSTLDPGLTPTRLLIHGASGRMGQALLRLCAADDGGPCTVVAASARTVRQRVVDGVPYFASSELAGTPVFDAVIDFSLPEAFDAPLALALDRGAGFVSGTTGLSDAQRAALAAAALRIPVVWEANFSLGVAVLGDLVERASAALPGWDCDIVEAHHVHKQDAPSGTALALGAAAGQGGATPRYASLRAGDIVGEHTVQFAATGERIELVHRATNRDIFARGALHAARRLAGRDAGRYRLRDLL